MLAGRFLVGIEDDLICVDNPKRPWNTKKRFGMPVGANAKFGKKRIVLPKVSVYILPKNTLLDAQGRTVLGALQSLGHNNVSDVRIGKVIQLDVEDSDVDSIHSQVSMMCTKLLANPVTEDFSIEVEQM